MPQSRTGMFQPKHLPGLRRVAVPQLIRVPAVRLSPSLDRGLLVRLETVPPLLVSLAILSCKGLRLWKGTVARPINGGAIGLRVVLLRRGTPRSPDFFSRSD